MVTQLQPDVRAYLHGGEVIKRYIRVEEVAHEYGFSVEETEYIAKAASSLYKLTRIHLVKKERFDEFMKHIYKVPGTNKQIIKKFARIGEASIIYSIGRHRFIELARAAGATYKINEGTGGTVLVNLEIFDNYMEQFRQPVRPLKEPLLIDGSVMRKACGDEKTAKWLEENLAIMPDVIRNAQKAAISHGSKLISVEFKFTNNGTEMTTCGIFGETGTDSEIDKWLERMKEDKEKEDKKTENMIAIDATTKNKVGFDTYA